MILRVQILVGSLGVHHAPGRHNAWPVGLRLAWDNPCSWTGSARCLRGVAACVADGVLRCGIAIAGKARFGMRSSSAYESGPHFPCQYEHHVARIPLQRRGVGR